MGIAERAEALLSLYTGSLAAFDRLAILPSRSD
jgi:hypothetical protein